MSGPRRIVTYSLFVGTLCAAALFAFAPGLQGAATKAQSCQVWPEWEAFRERFVDEGGRVVDRGHGQGQTTSEGQSYALFFALVANDRAAFDRILQWTERNLAGGDLTARLPAWQWGKKPDESWGILDENAASDSDLWIAYTLAEAGRLWKVPRYAALAELLADRILREETADIPGLGRTLLPAPKGFQPEPTLWRLNPSYVPVQLVQRMAALYPNAGWRDLVASSTDLIVRSAPRGFAPEWVLFRAGEGFQPDEQTKGEGSFNAVRVYLWAGLLAEDEPLRPLLVERLRPMTAHVLAKGVPPETVDTRTGVASGVGSEAFSSALIPLLAADGQRAAAEKQRTRLLARDTLQRNDNYYDQVLSLYGLGWLQGQYKFTRNGMLQTRWDCPGKPPRS